MAHELADILSEDYLVPVGGDLLQRPLAHLVSEAPREHGGGEVLDARRRVEGRLICRRAKRCELLTLLAVRDEQHDLSRVRAGTVAIVGEELPRDFEAARDRGLAVRRHSFDSRVDHVLVVRPSHARRRVCREGHHREARRVHAEEVLAHQLLGEGLQPLGPLHEVFQRAALIEQQNEVNRCRAGRLGRGRRRRGVKLRRRRRGRQGAIAAGPRADLVADVVLLALDSGNTLGRRACSRPCTAPSAARAEATPAAAKAAPAAATRGVCKGRRSLACTRGPREAEGLSWAKGD
eukprot:scaffold48808_cov57-Phaeocystis_antarctica.AAC.4